MREKDCIQINTDKAAFKKNDFSCAALKGEKIDGNLTLHSANIKKIVFLGTPAFALPSLRALHQNGFEVLAAVSQPDREKDKRGRLMPTPVKAECEKLGIPCKQFERISRDGLSFLQELKPDLMVTAAFGQLLSAEVLAEPKFGVLNVHASLLPKYRGSAPIQTCLLSGDLETGVTIMQTELGMDTGAILLADKLPIMPEDNAETLQEKLSELGANLLIKAIFALQDHTIIPQKQDDTLATYTKKITKADGIVNWDLPADKIVCQVRALYPWPAAYTFFGDKNIKIYRAETIPMPHTTSKSGTVLAASTKDGLVVSCGKDALKILCLQAPGKIRLPFEEFLKGFSLNIGDRFQKLPT